MSDVCILIDRPRPGAAAEGALLTGYDRSILDEKIRRAGLLPERVTVQAISQTPRAPDAGDEAECINRLNAHNYAIILPLDERALHMTTGKKSIWKWHMSPLDTVPELRARRAVPSFHPDQVKKDWSLNLYLEMALRRAAQNCERGPWVRKEERYVLGPDVEEAIARIEDCLARRPPWLSIDIETGRNQINTFGFATSPSDAVAIKVLPDEMSPAVFNRLWKAIADLCESDIPKVMQNGIYERLYLSRYGIQLANFRHDTMCAMKFLWPELEKGLDNVGRIYTMEPYWKDDGRVASEEGKQKDWGNIRDWPAHFRYNCADTSNTLIAMHGQRAALAQRGLLEIYDNYIQKLFDCVYEMGAHGLPVNVETQSKLIAEYEAKSADLVRRLSREINPRSPKAKAQLLKDKGYKLPTKRSTKKESTDELSLKKLRLKYPDDTDLKVLLEIAGIEKALSSYLRVRTHDDKRIRYQLDAHGTETGRMSCTKDPWDRGFNAQTLSDYAKQMIEWAPDEDRIFVEVDLRQAETRFVAYDACEETLLGMLERDEDIHSYVAAEIFAVSVAQVITEHRSGDSSKRQLGKKSGHGANYNMGVLTFQESCLKEMDLVLDAKMARRTLEAYHRLFPRIRQWHASIRETVYRERRLRNPLGRERYFYGRMDDNTYREAYAYRPQSTVPDIANHLMLGLKGARTEGALSFWLHTQVHDSVLLSCRPKDMERIAKYALSTDLWHPEVVLPAGRLVIPTEVKAGRCLGAMTKVKL